mmetsp:Transcript_31296/g.61435  ORF Transcript_31296/g.61435 Transcript_31296/m.61435 type:complete len:83 (+) Transcript_31296:545-793(+)
MLPFNPARATTPSTVATPIRGIFLLASQLAGSSAARWCGEGAPMGRKASEECVDSPGRPIMLRLNNESGRQSTNGFAQPKVA